MQQDILLIIIGAAIGFISSIGTTIVSDLINKQGKVKIYYKIVYSKIEERTWGFHDVSTDLIFEIPLWIELQNTSNTVRVVRDLNILLFKNGHELVQMAQINRTKKDIWYGNKGAYSFVLQPRSLDKYDLHFVIKKNEMGDNLMFDEVRLRYFDEKDKVHIFKVTKIEHCWELGNLNRERIWKLAKK